MDININVSLGVTPALEKLLKELLSGGFEETTVIEKPVVNTGTLIPEETAIRKRRTKEQIEADKAGLKPVTQKDIDDQNKADEAKADFADDRASLLGGDDQDEDETLEPDDTTKYETDQVREIALAKKKELSGADGSKKVEATARLKAVVQSFGAENISDLDPKHYAAYVAKIKTLK